MRKRSLAVAALNLVACTAEAPPEADVGVSANGLCPLPASFDLDFRFTACPPGDERDR